MNQLSLAVKNWRTVVPGVIFVICLYLKQDPHALDGLIDPVIGAKIYGWAALISGLATFATSKASNISGNDTPGRAVVDTSSTSVPPATPSPQTGTPISKGTSILSGLLAVFLITLSASGCAWIQSHQNTVTAIETDLVKVGASIAQTAANKGTLDFAQAIPLGLNSITDVIAALSTDKAKPVIANTVNQFSAWTLPQAQVNAIVAAYADAAPETPAARKAVLLGIAGDLSQGIMPAKKSSMIRMKRAHYAVEHIHIRFDKPLIFQGVDALKPTLGEVHFQNDPQRAFWIRGDAQAPDSMFTLPSK